MRTPAEEREGLGCGRTGLLALASRGSWCSGRFDLHTLISWVPPGGRGGGEALRTGKKKCFDENISSK